MSEKKALMKLSNDEQVIIWKKYDTIALNTKFKELDKYTQHGSTSTYIHCLAVTYYSVLLVKRFKIKCNEESLIIGALFHDYFFYDWHDKDKSHRLHGFYHPKRAYENAKEEYEINEIVGNIIKRHMFPLTFIPPKYREAFIVSLIDKLCSTYETFNKKNPYSTLLSEIEPIIRTYED